MYTLIHNKQFGWLHSNITGLHTRYIYIHHITDMECIICKNLLAEQSHVRYSGVEIVSHWGFCVLVHKFYTNEKIRGIELGFCN